MNEPAMQGRVLVIGSNARTVRLRDGSLLATGNYLNELIVPMQALRGAGVDLVVATPDGSKPPLDSRSIAASHFEGGQAALQVALDFYEHDPAFRQVRSLREVVAAGLGQFDGIFVPGGHAPIADLAANLQVGEILRHAHEEGKPTALLCHGPIALLSALPEPAQFQQALVRGDLDVAAAAASGWPYRGYRMTIFSNSEERPVERDVLGAALAFAVADALSLAGGKVEHGPDYAAFAVTDRELITGQNPRSDREVSVRFIDALQARRLAR